MNILVTGSAGFIGSHLVEKLLELGHKVTGIDNFDDFYPRNVKLKNIENALKNQLFTFVEKDICDTELIHDSFGSEKFDVLIHLAAKAGVRPSISNPIEYQKVNVLGTQNMLEYAKTNKIKQFVFASSSSVYGVNPNTPWAESDHVLMPISPYASSKVSCELLGHVYAHLYDIRFLGLRFFTVYGPRQRPDLAINKFIRLLENDEPITFYGDGTTKRDYTYVSDIVDGIISAMLYSDSQFEIINLGNSNTVSLRELLQNIEKVVNKKASINYIEQQDGDVPQTHANIDKAKALLNYEPKVGLLEGIGSFYSWSKNHDTN